MMKKNLIAVILTAAAFILPACQQSFDQPVGSDGWLTGGVNEKFETVTEHLGGFGKAMWEVDYRFQELYWGGSDSNWEYAAHQIAELEETLELGLQRRPERAASAELFINKAIPDVAGAIEERDPESFERSINLMMNTCNSCHALEEMPFLTVNVPVERRSTIR